MKLFNRLAAAAAVATFAAGGGASVASAYSISGGAYTSVPASNYTFTVGGGVYTISCSATFTGTATGAATTAMTLAMSGCSFFGFPMFVTQSGAWNVTVTGDDGAGTYAGELEIPSGTSTTMSIPIAGCTRVTAGPQTFQDGVNGDVIRLTNSSPAGNAELEMLLNDVSYTASGCPFSGGTDGVIDSNGPTLFPGVTVS